MEGFVKRAARVSFWLLAGVALQAGAQTTTSSFAIDSLNTPYPEFVRQGDVVSAVITGPSTASLQQTSVRLNGQDVSGLFSPGQMPGTLTGTVSGLQPGVNVIALYSSPSSANALAQLTVSTALPPRLGCSGLTSLVIPPDLLESPGDVVLIDTATPQAATATLPAHCILQGRINPRIGVNNTPFAIGFELRMPDLWSGRFFFVGGGGNDGILRPATGDTNNGEPLALARGFAVVSTDGGHQGTSASSYGFDPQARIDHAYNAYGKSTATAKAIIDLYYGKLPDKSYFGGCSGGGRQGMMFTQRYPTYFDGVIAGAPAMRVATGASSSAAWQSFVFNSISPVDNNGNHVLSQAFSNADLTLVSTAILDACDGLDGAVDGSVNNIAACHFDPAVLRCGGNGKQASCLSPLQVSALKKAFGGPFGGQPVQALYTTWPFDAGIGDAGWRAWTLGTSTTVTPNSRFFTLIQDAMANEFFTPPDPTFSIFHYNFATDPARQVVEGQLYDSWADANLAAFTAHGGKILFHHGRSDPIFSSNDTIDYFTRFAQAHGGPEQAASSERLYLVPGMTHCSGGPATDQYDTLSKMIDWVENGNVPEEIIATGQSFPGRTRPLCPYPTYAQYTGAGSIEDANNFVCQNPAQ